MMLFLFVLMLVGVDTPDSVVETIRGQRCSPVLAAARPARPDRLRDRRRAQRGPTVGLDEANAATRRQRRVAGRPDLRPLRVRVRADLGPADHRGRRGHGAGPPAPGRPRSPVSANSPRSGCGPTPRTGAHPGTLPNSGVLALHNSIATPALLPDGSVAETSVSARRWPIRGVIVDAPAIAAGHRARRSPAIERVVEEEDDDVTPENYLYPGRDPVRDRRRSA